MGGGTLIMGQVNNGPVSYTELVSLHRTGLNGISVSGGVARVGAAATMAEIEQNTDLSFLHSAMRSLASPSIRNLATVGGNLHAPQPYGDFAVCLLALGATVEIEGNSGPRRCTMDEFVVTGTDQGEFVVAVVFDVPTLGTWFYHKAMRRKMNSAALVTIAALAHTEGDKVASSRIALGGVARTPVRAVTAEAFLAGKTLTGDVLDDAGAAARADIAPFDDAYATAWYRSRVLPVHFRRAFAD